MRAGSVEGLDAAPVHHEGLAAHPGRGGRSEIEHGRGDVGGLAQAVDGGVGEHPGFDLGGEHGGEGVGAGGAGAHVVDAYAHGAVVEGQVRGHVVEGGFRRAVDGHGGAVVDAAHGGDVDDTAVACGLHVGRGLAAQLPGGEHVDGVDALHVGAVDVEGVFAAATTHSGVVHQDVDGAVGGHGKVDEGLEIGAVEHVAGRGGGASAGGVDGVGHAAGLVGRNVAHHHRGACCCQDFTRCFAYAVASAGDNGHAAREVEKRICRFLVHDVFSFITRAGRCRFIPPGETAAIRHLWTTRAEEIISGC